MMKKVMIIGGGPGGISAALYAKRGGLDTAVFYTEKSSLFLAHEIDNYYGCPHISGEELYQRGLSQARDLGVEMIREEVLAIAYDGRFIVTTGNGSYDADFVILATGAYRNRPAVKGLKDLEGKGVSYCAVCDGFFYRRKQVAVLGDAAYALHEAEYLRNIAEKVIILTNGKEPSEEGLEDFEIYTGKIAELAGEKRLEKAVLEDGTEIPLNGLFIAMGSAGSADLARKIGTYVSDNGKVVVNEKQETGVPGLYAVGDSTEGIMQISKAVYEGMTAAQDIIKKQKGS